MRTLTRATLVATAITGLLVTAGATGVAHAAPAASDQTFQLHYNSALSEQVAQVIGHGAVSGVGTEVEDIGDTGGQAILTFANGSVVLDVEIAGETSTLNLTACHATVALTGSWDIAQGSGAYAGAAGSGIFTGIRQLHGTRIKGVCQGPDSGVEPRTVTEDVLLTGAVSAG